MSAELNIAQILYDTGEVKFRYARIVAEDGSRWIRDGFFANTIRTVKSFPREIM